MQMARVRWAMRATGIKIAPWQTASARCFVMCCFLQDTASTRISVDVHCASMHAAKCLSAEDAVEPLRLLVTACRPCNLHDHIPAILLYSAPLSAFGSTPTRLASMARLLSRQAVWATTPPKETLCPSPLRPQQESPDSSRFRHCTVVDGGRP
jgi:hypothetical protein